MRECSILGLIKEAIPFKLYASSYTLGGLIDPGPLLNPLRLSSCGSTLMSFAPPQIGLITFTPPPGSFCTFDGGMGMSGTSGGSGSTPSGSGRSFFFVLCFVFIVGCAVVLSSGRRRTRRCQRRTGCQVHDLRGGLLIPSREVKGSERVRRCSRPSLDPRKLVFCGRLSLS